MGWWNAHPSFKASFYGRTPSSTSPKSEQRASLLTPLPPKETWIETGIVERRTVHANVIWRERQLVLTKDCIYFARIDSDLVVDKIRISEIKSIAKVESGGSSVVEERNAKKPNANSSKSRKTSVLTNISLSDNFESFYETQRETYAFEIKALVGNFQRSYFVRVKTFHDCESWISAVTECLNSTMREFTDKHGWLQKQQRSARELHSMHSFRCLVAFLILLDFLSSIFKSEFLPTPDSRIFFFFKLLDLILFVFFCSELLLNMFGNWRTLAGAPFSSRLTSWYQVQKSTSLSSFSLLCRVLGAARILASLFSMLLQRKGSASANFSWQSAPAGSPSTFFSAVVPKPPELRSASLCSAPRWRSKRWGTAS